MFSKILSFFFMINLLFSSSLGINPIGYSSHELIADTSFSEGFNVIGANGIEEGKFIFKDSSNPKWRICQWNSPTGLINNGNVTDTYTISDISKSVYCNPSDKLIKLTIDASKIYNGNAAPLENWPHLLIEQSPFEINDSNRNIYSCDNKIVFSCDIRLADYVPTTNTDGVNAAQYLAYFYISGKNANDFIWFGVNLFDDRGLQDTTWSRDFSEGAHNMIYTVSTKGTYGLNSRSILIQGISDKFVHVSVDLTQYISDCLSKANEDNTFGKEVSSSDFHFTGMNIGFEMHGNIKCSVECKNISLKSYS